MAEPVRKLGPYRLLNKIGRGAFGVVWLAEKQSSIVTTRFALKLPRDEDIDLQAFKREAAIWLRASGHPNVLPMIEANIYDEQLVIVTEYVPDGSLTAWLNHHGGHAPSIEAACEIIDGVLAGLAHLHERRVIHRDLKPDNILLQRGTPRLTDFGISRLLRSSSSSASVGGTLPYMAPEVFDGKRNQWTDIWAVGVIFYQLLAGRLPYPQRDTASLIAAILRFDPPPLPPSVPPVLREIVMKALRRDPANRHASAAQMQHALRKANYRVIEPVEPPRPGPAPIDQKTLTLESTLPLESKPVASFGIPTLTKPGEPVWPIVIACIVFLLIAFLISLYNRPSLSTSRQTIETASERAADKSYVIKQTLQAGSGVYSIALSQDKKLLASGSQDGVVRLWDVQTGQLLRKLNGHSSLILSVAFSPDGNLLASGSFDASVRIWDVRTGQSPPPLNMHKGPVYSIAFSPDGSMLASGSADKTVIIWNAQTGLLLRKLPKHNDSVRSVAFSPDGNTLASGSADNRVRIWNMKTVLLWNGETSLLPRELLGHTDSVLSVAFSPNGKWLASGSADTTVRVWDAQTGDLLQSLHGHSVAVYSVAFSPLDGNKLASGLADYTVALWELQEVKPDRDTLERERDKKDVGRWDAQNEATIKRFIFKQNMTEHLKEVRSVVFSSDGNVLASGSLDATVKLRQLE